MVEASTEKSKKRSMPEVNWAVAQFTYVSYFIAITIGHLRDFFGSITGVSRYRDKTTKKGYATLTKSWESFYTRRLYHRFQDCWNRPICSAPSAHITVMERASTDSNCTLQTTGKTIECLNLGSYNYLGFADDWKATCRDEVMAAVDKYPNSMCTSRIDLGTLELHRELERTVARFVKKEDAIIFTMGYGTNLTVIPAIMGDESLIISDSLNHLSIVNGARSSSSSIRVFRHNDAAQLEEILREAIVKGQPKHHRPWKKILVMVEGIYSMEGTICDLASIVKVCKKYKAYIYVDEAHSIGALGETGRGVCEHEGVDPADIDILMGTFTKSFSGMGGYIASSKRVIDFLRANSAGILYHNAMSPVVCSQILTAFRIIMGEDGTDIGRQKLDRLTENSNYFRTELIKMGLHVYGDYDSPIIPVLVYIPAKIAAFSHECLRRGIAVVVVGFPATSILTTRTRFCISAGHTREDLDYALKVIDEVSTLLCLKYDKNIIGLA